MRKSSDAGTEMNLFIVKIMKVSRIVDDVSGGRLWHSMY